MVWLQSEVTSVGKINEGVFPFKEIQVAMELFCILIVVVVLKFNALVKTHKSVQTKI